MFVDIARIRVEAGDGGNGMVAFRREKFVPHGGPSGGDGGRGGDVVFTVDEGLRTLMDFRYQRHFRAEPGEKGGTKNMHGRDGQDLVVKVPPGTLVRDEDTGEVLADLTLGGQSAVVARGGRGGRGNARFTSATHQAPRFAEKGEPGEQRNLVLELKLLADAGLVGFPNAGKSTLLSRLSAARPKIADYPFTTITPNLGVVTVPDGRSFVLADIPGLIEGAHEGTGLGHEFLRHVERTKVLIHVVDSSGQEGRNPLHDFDTIREELRLYDPALAERPTLVALNKIDLPQAVEKLPVLTEMLKERGFRVFHISGVTGAGLEPLLFAAIEEIERAEARPVEEAVEPEVVYRIRREEPYEIVREGHEIVVRGRDVERIVAMTDFANEEAVHRFQRYLVKSGIEAALRKRGVREGETVRIRDVAFEWTERGMHS